MHALPALYARSAPTPVHTCRYPVRTYVLLHCTELRDAALVRVATGAFQCAGAPKRRTGSAWWMVRLGHVHHMRRLPIAQ
jgi:hypothetical protein